MANNRILKNSKGVLLVELAIVLPLMILLLFVGILELGRLLSQVSWLANVAYVSVLTGGENPPGVGENMMYAKYNQLADLQSGALSSKTPHAQYNQANDQVEMDITANVKTLTPIVTLPISMRLVGPMLMLDPAVAGDLDSFDNPTCLYNCNGVKTSCCAPYVACGSWVCIPPPSPPVIPGKYLTDVYDLELNQMYELRSPGIERLR